MKSPETDRDHAQLLLNLIRSTRLSDPAWGYIEEWAISVLNRSLDARQLAKENEELRHDIARSMANHNADLNARSGDKCDSDH